MKKIISLCIVIATVTISFAQKETFELVTYSPPKGWKKEIKKNAYTSYTITNKQSKSYCQIFIMLSTASKGGIKEDFESEWQTLVAKQYGVTTAPQVTEPNSEDGWQAKGGIAPFTFNNGKSTALLTTMSGYNKAVSIVAVTNSQDFMLAIQSFLESVDMKKPSPDNIVNKQTSQQTTQSVSNGKFAFTTTNFDDGWTCALQENWVQVTKGNITVLLHYAKEGTTTAADPEPHINNAWNILVASRYSNLKNYKIASPSLDPQRAYLGAGELTEKNTGRQVYVALFRKGNSNWVEFITPDKNSFVKEFGTDINNIGWDASSDIWNPLLKMFKYNKFAVAASDLTGNWASWSGSNVQYVNVYTGLDAGMGHVQSGNEIIFNTNGTYNREYKGVSGGPGGSNKYSGEKINGKAIVSNWELQLTNSFKGETHVFAVQFEAIKGGRILHLYRGNIEELHLYKTK